MGGARGKEGGTAGKGGEGKEGNLAPRSFLKSAPMVNMCINYSFCIKFYICCFITVGLGNLSIMRFGYFGSVMYFTRIYWIF